MTDLNGDGAARRVDKLIDGAVSRRAGRAAGDAPAAAAARPGPDEALIVELSGLTAIDWPADETGGRIAAAVASAATASQSPGGQPGRARPAAAWYSRPARRRWLVAAAAAVAALLVAGLLQLTGGGSHPTAGPGPAVSTPARSSSPAATPHHPPRISLTAMRIVAGSAGLRAVGAVNINSNFLTCVTRSVCYVLGSADGGKKVDIARSLNGGATWTPGAPLPSMGTPQEFNALLSCPRPLTCFTPYGTSVLETSDGFAHYSVLPVSVPSIGAISEVSCPARLDCVAAVELSDYKTRFAYSHDGGVSWTEASAGTGKLGKDDIIAGLRCDSRGACIAADIVGTEQTPLVAALTSANGGRTWTRSGNYPIVNMQQYMVSCADAHDCLIGSNAGYLAWVHATGNGHIGIRVQAFPKNWSPVATQVGVAVSCATGQDCFVETSQQTIEATRDAGHTWTPVPLPASLPNDTAPYLSCPIPAGCIGLASDGQGDQSSWSVISNLNP